MLIEIPLRTPIIFRLDSKSILTFVPEIAFVVSKRYLMADIKSGSVSRYDIFGDIPGTPVKSKIKYGNEAITS